MNVSSVHPGKITLMRIHRLCPRSSLKLIRDCRIHWACILLVLLFGDTVQADKDQYFRDYVEPILKTHCFDCHSHESGDASGGLVLDSRAGWSVGGDSGPSIVPGEPEKSLLLQAVDYEDDYLQMPPDGKLSATERDILRKWIVDGAVDPRTDGKAAEKKGIDWGKGRQWWSFRPLKPIERSENAEPATIDFFIERALAEHHLEMAPEAEPEVLLRRVYYDLTGLPPTPSQIKAFVAQWNQADRSNGSHDLRSCYVEAVDHLLSSPQFGEKWGRHWLDVARYADSNGSSFNPPFREAWRYRNWVIDSMNNGMPVDEFLRKQVAGDLLPAESQKERDDNLIATGYLMLGSKVLGAFDKEQLTLDVIDEQIDTLGKSMLAMTVACARCHDHKFDPIPQTDYYAMAGIFSSTRTLDNRLGGVNADESDWSRRGLGAGADEQLAKFLSKYRHKWVDANGKVFRANQKVEKLADDLKSTESDAREEVLRKLEKVQKELEEAKTRLQSLDEHLPEFAMAVADATEPADIPLRIRGVAASKGEIVPRGFLKIAEFEGQPQVRLDQSGRLELANWITDPRNPLTPRVFVNRVWKHLFDEGIVRSVDNFGMTGELPTHPELLDHLTVKFIDSGWQLKALVREIVLSRAYRMSVTPSPTSDPENRLLSHQNRRRLTPEEIRDTLLLQSGRLDLSQGMGQIDHLPLGDVSNLGEVLKISDNRRTIYQPVIRTLEPEVLQLFDSANSAMATGDRPSTIVAPQALYFMNSEFVQQSASQIASRLASQPSTSTRAVVTEAFLTICCRPPTSAELEVLTEYLGHQFEGPEGPTQHDLTKLCQAILGSTQFQFVE